MKDDFVSRKQTNLLSTRIRKAAETSATQELYSYLLDFSKQNHSETMNILVVGAGGSYPASLAIADSLCTFFRTPFVIATYPQTAIKILQQFDYLKRPNFNIHNPPKAGINLVIGVSYSGKTPDIKAVFDQCSNLDCSIPFVLLTGAEKEQIENLYHENELCKIISYFNKSDRTGKERGMISMFSTLAPLIIFDGDCSHSLFSSNTYLNMLAEGEEFINDMDIYRLARAIKHKPTIHVFYERETYPTAADVESKFIESGIANVILHEKKNFSHGRYTSLYKQDFALVLNLVRYSISPITYKLVYGNEYDKELAGFLEPLCKKVGSHYIEFGSSNVTNLLWNLRQMCKLPYLITAIGEELNIDISKPLLPFPDEVKVLYEYEGDFY